jgi:uncharacterized protein
MNNFLSRPAIVLLIILAWSLPALCGQIHDAAKAGDIAKVKALLKDDPALVSSKDKNGYTSLYLAVDYGHKDVAELLLDNNAKINAKGNGATPLHIAVEEGHKAVAKFLRQHGGHE